MVSALFEAHRQVTGGPIFNAAVWGRNLEDFDQTVTFEMNDQTVNWDQDFTDGTITRLVRINQTVGFELGQPVPAQTPYQFQVFQAGIPTVKTNQARLKAARRRCGQHSPKMVILAELIVRLVIDPKVTRQMG